MTGSQVENESTDVALTHRYRRRLLYCLFTYANPMRLPDIAEQLTIWEYGGKEDDHTSKRLGVYNALYHEHLPALREAGFVEYHQEEDTVELGPAAAQVKDAILDRLLDEIGELLQAEGRIL